MQYSLEFKPAAVRDLQRLSPPVARRIIAKIEEMMDNLKGDVKRLTQFTPGWRLRVGDWRVLFDIVGSVIVIWRVVHRSKAYD
jgi:mRNA interferase RelE/StbE